MFTQEQLNTVVRSYEEENLKLLQVKASQALTIQERNSMIQDLRKQLAEKSKKVEELEKLNSNGVPV